MKITGHGAKGKQEALENAIGNARRELRRRDISDKARASWQESLDEWQRELAALPGKR